MKKAKNPNQCVASLYRFGGFTTHGKSLKRVDACRIRTAQGKNLGHICNHSLRAIDIPVYLENGGEPEITARIAAHQSP